MSIFQNIITYLIHHFATFVWNENKDFDDNFNFSQSKTKFSVSIIGNFTQNTQKRKKYIIYYIIKYIQKNTHKNTRQMHFINKLYLHNNRQFFFLKLSFINLQALVIVNLCFKITQIQVLFFFLNVL